MHKLENMKLDAIIVGTGPGGATVAKELAKRGKQVLMLEWGPGGPVKGNIIQYFFQQCFPGKGMLITNNFLGMVRGITTGGSSLFYYGTCFPVPHDMLKKYGIDVRREEEEARRELPIATLKDEMVTPMAQRIMESAQALGYAWTPLQKFMYQDRWRPGMKFGYYGDKHRVKWSARMHAEEAVAMGAVLLNKARVSNIILDGNRATGVEFKMKGRSYKAFAPKVIVAAGGIGSPVILRKMGLKNVGYNFFYDPLITVCGKVDDVRKRIDEIPMTAGVHFPEDGIVMTDMAIPTLIDKAFTAQVLRFWRLFETRKTLRIMIKVRDDLAGRLTDSGGVRKKLTQADRDKLMKGYDIAKRILEKAGAKGIYKTWYLAAHPGGTVKMGEFLDANLKVKNYENLFVCDCSVIPEPWGLPPALTLVCLGKRLAKHLAGEKTGANAAAPSKAKPAKNKRKKAGRR
ncbi:MAG TPA: GMC family oxidoreductase [Spirochaetota bacterium]|nr:GMC family oxidoreductase [Spirochaetota bacterium]HPI22824.1 GMC family oxidoreductase [Spirochaetota bacterium]HPU89120.1 GMC family oxidoreductase [Spirochaetota bacterium]